MFMKFMTGNPVVLFFIAVMFFVLSLIGKELRQIKKQIGIIQIVLVEEHCLMEEEQVEFFPALITEK